MILEFFIAFFGLIYFTTRIGNERAIKAETEKNRHESAELYKQWIKKFTEPNLERELRSMVEDASRYDEVWSAVKGDYEKMPSQSIDGSVPITFERNMMAYSSLTTKQRADRLREDRKNVLRLLMAHHGKILTFDSTGSIGETHAGFRTDPTAYQICERQYEYMSRLNQVSEENNGPRIVFHALTDKKCHELSERMHESSVGEYLWENPLCDL